MSQVLLLVAQSYPALCDPMTVIHQAPLFMEFSREEYWKGLPCPSPEELPYSRIKKLGLPHCSQILYHLSHQGSLSMYQGYHNLSLQSCTHWCLSLSNILTSKYSIKWKPLTQFLPWTHFDQTNFFLSIF